MSLWNVVECGLDGIWRLGEKGLSHVEARTQAALRRERLGGGEQAILRVRLEPLEETATEYPRETPEIAYAFASWEDKIERIMQAAQVAKLRVLAEAIGVSARDLELNRSEKTRLEAEETARWWKVYSLTPTVIRWTKPAVEVPVERTLYAFVERDSGSILRPRFEHVPFSSPCGNVLDEKGGVTYCKPWGVQRGGLASPEERAEWRALARRNKEACRAK